MLDTEKKIDEFLALLKIDLMSAAKPGLTGCIPKFTITEAGGYFNVTGEPLSEYFDRPPYKTVILDRIYINKPPETVITMESGDNLKIKVNGTE